MSLKIKIESDLHIDFEHGYIPDLTNVNIYCIAGDLGELKNCSKFLINLTEKYPNVDIIYTHGNHETYNTYLEKTSKILGELNARYPKIHYLNNDSIIINGIKFILSCFWTSFNNSNPTDMYLASVYMNDYKKIRYANGQLRFTPEYSIRLHKIAKEYIFKTLEESKEKCIVITHHMPIIKPYNELDAAYGTELRNEIAELKNKPIIWAYGHQHKFADEIFNFLDGETRFISNPHGYPFEETGFKKDFIVEI